MGKESKFTQGERKRLEKMQQLRLLPTIYKKIGTWMAVLALLTLFTANFFGYEIGDPKFIVRSVLICGLLLVSISKDQIEDELTLKLRTHAFVTSFISGVIYTIIRSFTDYGIDRISSQEYDPNSFSSFELILVMLMIQIMFYHLFKKIR